MVGNISPFKFGQIVEGKAFTNRVKEMQFFENNLLSGNHIVLISPRRYGKTSLVQEFMSKTSNDSSLIHCSIDLFSIRTEEEFYESLASELIKSSSNKVEEWIQSGKELFKHLIPRISIGTDTLNDFSISFDIREIIKHKEEIVNLAEKIAIKKKKRVILYLDEFQNIQSFKNSLDLQKLLRSMWQKHKNVSYCIYGSKRHMMQELFDQPECPFYKFGSIYFLERIDTKNWVDFIVKGFSKTNKVINNKEAEFIAELMKNHPHYVQQLAHFAWSYTENVCTRDVILYAHDFMLKSNSPLFIKMIEELSATQINLLKAVFNEEKHFTAKNVMHDYNLGTPRNVQKNRFILERKDLIDKVSGKYQFIDPLFETWFKGYV